MDEQTLKNEVNNQNGHIQAFNQGIYNSPITQNFYDSSGQPWSTSLRPVEELRLESFKLGDDTAANFRYIIDPIREVYNEAVQALKEASDPMRRVKGGILLLGEANVGKTRLALEALKQVLPARLVLRWQPHYTINHIPPIQVLREKPLILFLDDLHEYVSTQTSLLSAKYIANNPYLGTTPSFENSRVMVLRILLETLLQVSPSIVIVATCRSEHLESAIAELGDHLLVRLKEIYLPSFNSDVEETYSKQIIAVFQQEGRIHLGDWDGTIGSLVLGLSRKRDQYVALPEYAQVVLKAIKLLAWAFIFAYPEQDIRKICVEIFPNARHLQEDGLWQDTIDLLLRDQFIIEDPHKMNRGPVLAIRSDSYLEKVISDYPPPHRRARLEQDLSELLEILSDIGDSEALSSLAFSFFMQRLHEKALDAFDRSHLLNDSNTISWTNKGVCLTQLGRVEEALQAFEQAIKIDNSNLPARTNKGYCLEWLDRYDEALNVFEQILSLYPDDTYSWTREGACLSRLGQYNKALEALEQALYLDTSGANTGYIKSYHLAATVWVTKGFCFSKLGQYDKALEALGRVCKLITRA